MSPYHPSNYADNGNISIPIEVPILNKIVLDFDLENVSPMIMMMMMMFYNYNYKSCQFDYVQGIVYSNQIM